MSAYSIAASASDVGRLLGDLHARGDVCKQLRSPEVLAAIANWISLPGPASLRAELIVNDLILRVSVGSTGTPGPKTAPGEDDIHEMPIPPRRGADGDCSGCREPGRDCVCAVIK